MYVCVYGLSCSLIQSRYSETLVKTGGGPRSPQ